MVLSSLYGTVFALTLIFSVIVALIQLIRGEDWLHAVSFLCTVSIVAYIELESHSIGVDAWIHTCDHSILRFQRLLYFIGCLWYGYSALRKLRQKTHISSAKE